MVNKGLDDTLVVSWTRGSQISATGADLSNDCVTRSVLLQLNSCLSLNLLTEFDNGKIQSFRLSKPYMTINSAVQCHLSIYSLIFILSAPTSTYQVIPSVQQICFQWSPTTDFVQNFLTRSWASPLSRWYSTRITKRLQITCHLISPALYVSSHWSDQMCVDSDRISHSKANHNQHICI